MEPLAASVPLEGIEFAADISLRARKRVVLFAYASGRQPPQSEELHVAALLNHGERGTILIDLLAEGEG